MAGREGGMHGRGGEVGASVAEGVHGRGACVVGGHAWWGHAWQGDMHGGGMCGWGA